MNLVNLNAAQTMSSREIAELTGKNHADVLADIRKMLKDLEKDQSCFADIFLDAYERKQPMFSLDREHTDCLLTGYSAKARMIVIKRWHELEAKQPVLDLNDPVALRNALLTYSEKVIQLENKIEADKPKVVFAEAVRKLQGACMIGDFAKSIGWGRNRLFKWLRDNKCLMAGNMPYQTYVDRELFVVIEQLPYVNNKGESIPSFTTMLTGKGQVWLENKIRAAELVVSEVAE